MPCAESWSPVLCFSAFIWPNSVFSFQSHIFSIFSSSYISWVFSQSFCLEVCLNLFLLPLNSNQVLKNVFSKILSHSSYPSFSYSLFLHLLYFSFSVYFFIPRRVTLLKYSLDNVISLPNTIKDPP